MWSCILPGGLKPHRRKGFTLVEMLVAIVILAVVLTIAYSVFSSSYSALHRVNPDRDPFQTARLILDRMTEEIQSAYHRPGLGYTGFVGKSDEKDEAPWDSLTFSTMANFYWIKKVEGINESDFLRISYTLVEDEEERRLMRAQDPAFGPFEDDWETLSSTERGVHQLADGVWGIDLRYFDGEDWVEDWNSADQEKLPRAVEVKLILETAAGKRLPFYTVIPVGSS